MNDAECKAIEQECVEKVRKALKLITSAEIYDRKGYLNEKGYKALEEIEGLDLFWICDPLIKLVKKDGEWIPVSERLPEESLNSVIGWDAYRERCVFVQYIGGHFQITGRAESFNIVAWQPLPEPYKKGGTKNER